MIFFFCYNHYNHIHYLCKVIFLLCLCFFSNLEFKFKDVLLFFFLLYIWSVVLETVQLWDLSVLNQWQQSIHKHSLPAASGTSHKGLRVPARMTQLPGLRATTQEKQLNFSWHGHSRSACSCSLQGRREKQNTFLDLCLRVLGLGHNFAHWDVMRNSSDLAGYFLFLFCCIQARARLCNYSTPVQRNWFNAQASHLRSGTNATALYKTSESWQQVSLLVRF